MERIVAETKHHYRRTLEVKEQKQTLTTDIRNHLLEELVGDDKNDYIDPSHTKTYLAECTKHNSYETSHVLLHVVCRAQDHLPLLLIHRVMRRVETLLHIYSRRTSVKKLVFWLVPTPATRQFPLHAHAHILGRHINGGFTYPSLRQVYLYRLEEFPKVVLHETLHHLPVDTSSLWDSASISSLYSLFHIDQNGCPSQCSTVLNPNEAIIEAWANAYHIAFISMEYNIPWGVLYDMEMMWAWRQTCKILRKQQSLGGSWREGTHSYSYIVLRTILLHHVDTMIRMRNEGNPVLNFTRCVQDFVKTGKLKEKLRRSCAASSNSQPASLRMTILGDL